MKKYNLKKPILVYKISRVVHCEVYEEKLEYVYLEFESTSETMKFDAQWNQENCPMKNLYLVKINDEFKVYDLDFINDLFVEVEEDE